MNPISVKVVEITLHGLRVRAVRAEGDQHWIAAVSAPIILDAGARGEVSIPRAPLDMGVGVTPANAIRHALSHEGGGVRCAGFTREIGGVLAMVEAWVDGMPPESGKLATAQAEPDEDEDDFEEIEF